MIQFKNDKTKFKVSSGVSTREKISRDKGIIYGMSIIKAGQALGHDTVIDDVFLDQIADYWESSDRKGYKARFGHPGFFTDGIGTFVGRIKNFKRSSDSVVGDLHLSNAAKETPMGNLYNYILTMAEEDADMFGLSIVFSNDMLSSEKASKDGTWRARLDELYAVDIVDEPAANASGLFSSYAAGHIKAQFEKYLEDGSSVDSFFADNGEITRRIITKLNSIVGEPESITEEDQPETVDYRKHLAREILKRQIGGIDE